MKSLVKFLIVSLLVSGIFISVSFIPVKAQTYGSPTIIGTPLPSYGYYGGINPSIGSPFLGNSYYSYGSLYNPMGSYNPYYSLIQQFYEMYDYLNYCLRFYEIAKQTPFFYLYDQTADYLRANLYNYAGNLGVSPQESILYFIQQTLFTPQQE